MDAHSVLGYLYPGAESTMPSVPTVLIIYLLHKFYTKILHLKLTAISNMKLHFENYPVIQCLKRSRFSYLGLFTFFWRRWNIPVHIWEGHALFPTWSSLCMTWHSCYVVSFNDVTPCSNSWVIMVVADGLAPIWPGHISKHMRKALSQVSEWLSLSHFCVPCHKLTLCGPVTQNYVNIGSDNGLAPVHHETNVDLSLVRSSKIHLRTISQYISQPSITRSETCYRYLWLD